MTCIKALGAVVPKIPFRAKRLTYDTYQLGITIGEARRWNFGSGEVYAITNKGGSG